MHKVHDRVRRCAKQNGAVAAGTLGHVTKVDDKFTWVLWDGSESADWYPHNEGHIEAFAHASEPQPAPSERGRLCAHGVDMGEPCSGCQGAAGEEPPAGSWQCPAAFQAELDGHKKAGEIMRNELVGLRSELADAKAERDRHAADASDLRIRLGWLERENARLTGKKGAR